MAAMDVFRGDGLTMVELTAAINRMAYAPGKIGAMNLFRKQGVTTTTVDIERKGGKVSLLPSKPRGTPGTVHERSGRALRTINIPHIPHDATILASQVQGIREFGSENELESVASVTAEHLQLMRQNHEVTHEFYRLGAVQGIVTDGDGTTVLLNMFNDFGVVQKTVDFVLGTSATEIKLKALEVTRHIEDALGGLAYSGIQAFCGDSFFDDLITHANVKEAWLRHQDGAFLREIQRPASGTPQPDGFMYAGIWWTNYRGKVGATNFIPTTDARFVPIGVQDLFNEYYAPADMMSAVNTRGLPTYASQEIMKHDRGVELHTQSNPISICTIPECLVRGFSSN